MIDGLSYSDWEDDAERLRKLALGSNRLTRKHIERVEELIASLQDELDAVESVLPGLTGFDAIRVGCVRDLIIALRAGLFETRRMLEARKSRRTAKPRKGGVPA